MCPLIALSLCHPFLLSTSLPSALSPSPLPSPPNLLLLFVPPSLRLFPSLSAHAHNLVCICVGARVCGCVGVWVGG